MHDPDADDVALAGGGDRAAAARLISRHGPRLYALARRMLGRGAEAEDAVQETFLKLWTHAGRWRPGGAKFETWLYRVALNECYDRLRRRRRREAPLDAAMAVADGCPGPDERLAARDVAAAVAAALAALPERQQAALLLCHFEGCANRQAAEKMGLSVEALESLLARGRRNLRANLAHLKDSLGEQ